MSRLDLRRRLHDREGHRCWYCDRVTVLVCGDRRSDRATNDHLIPTSRGGTDDETNQVSACRRCNEAKGALTEAEFRSMSSVDAIRFNDAVALYGPDIGVIETAMAAGPGYRPGPRTVTPFRQSGTSPQAQGYREVRKA